LGGDDKDDEDKVLQAIVMAVIFVGTVKKKKTQIF
jgi:hypothetical protein